MRPVGFQSLCFHSFAADTALSYRNTLDMRRFNAYFPITEFVDASILRRNAHRGYTAACHNFAANFTTIEERVFALITEEHVENAFNEHFKPTLAYVMLFVFVFRLSKNLRFDHSAIGASVSLFARMRAGRFGYHFDRVIMPFCGYRSFFPYRTV